VPASWVDICDGTKGLAYLHAGTGKHWVKDSTLVNLFAWGEDTEAIGSRLWRYNWPKSFDQRLNGTHTIRSALYPHSGTWRSADVMGISRNFGMKPLCVPGVPQKGILPNTSAVLTIKDPGVCVTSVRSEASQLVCRLFSTALKPLKVRVASRLLKPEGLSSLKGEVLEELKPYHIGELRLRSGGKSSKGTKRPLLV
jgi:hypothetical protein